MPTLRDCLRLLDEVSAAARDPESAYVVRTRLKRSLLAIAQLAAAQAGTHLPSMPDDIRRVEVDDPKGAELLRLCESLLARTRSLCQPSEALDSRWRVGWLTVNEDLQRLEVVLRMPKASFAPGRRVAHEIPESGNENQTRVEDLTS